jgi:hypothetical protein
MIEYLRLKGISGMLLFTLVKYFCWPMLKHFLEKRKSTKAQSEDVEREAEPKWKQK